MPRKKEDLSQLEQLSVDELKKMSKDISTSLAALEDQHRQATITDQSYNETKKRTLAKKAKINEILYNMGITVQTEPEEDKTPQASQTPTTPAKQQSPQKPVQPTTQSSDKKDQPKPQEKPKPESKKAGTPQASPAATPTGQGISESKFNIEMEKLKMLLDTIKESRTATEEKIMTITESLGELRSIVYQREGVAKDQDVKLQTVEEQLADIKPEKIEKDFTKRDKNISSHDMKIEKLEFKVSDLVKNLGDIKTLLRSIGGLENISTVNTDIIQKLGEITDRHNKINRLADKIENIFVELNKGMEDFFMYKAKQETLDELVKELMKTTDTLSVELKEYVSKKDLGELKEDILTIGNRIEELKKLIDVITPIVKLKTPEKIQNLQSEKEDIEVLISSLEDSYRKGKVTQEEFRDVKMKNQEKLNKIVKELELEWNKFSASKSKTEPSSAKPSPPATNPVKPVIQSKAQPITKPSTQQPAKPLPVSTPAKPSQTPSQKPTPQPPKEPPVDSGSTIEKKKDKQQDNFVALTVKSEKKKSEPKKESKPPKTSGGKENELATLKESFESGLISKKAFELAKKMLESSGD